jgi:hypothetical protein
LPASIGTTAKGAPSTDNAAAGAGLLEGARLLWHELSGIAHDSLQLAALETKLAAQSLVMMIAAGVMVAVLLVSAWLGLVATAILALIGGGMGASTALLLGVFINLVVAVLLCAVIHRKSRHVRWSATIRSLRPLAKTQPEMERR